MQIASNGISLEVDSYDSTDPAAPVKAPIVLIMGLGMPRTAWPLPLIDLLRATGHRVIRFDNRDSGQSSRLEQWGRPKVGLMMLRFAMHLPVRASYALSDMVSDTVGMLDALGIARAHIVGASMGGMIGQLMAIEHPQRVASFTCIMSSSGARSLPQPSLTVRRALMSRPSGPGREALIDHYVKLIHIIGSPGYRPDQQQLRQRIVEHLAPHYFPLGTARQLMAIAADGDRSARLAKLHVPMSIIHGRNDPLIPVAAAYDLARKVPHAKLEVIDGMGHDMPPALLGTLASSISAQVALHGVA